MLIPGVWCALDAGLDEIVVRFQTGRFTCEDIQVESTSHSNGATWNYTVVIYSKERRGL